MKERPILFSGAMVRSILAGRKTQTRREVKGLRWIDKTAPGIEPYWFLPDHPRKEISGGTPMGPHCASLCPYGQPGDRLWVRETWGPIYPQDPHYNGGHPIGIDYKASHSRESHQWRVMDDLGTRRWKPSIHMPRWACRILLEITGVRVERLQDISEADALAEGIESLAGDKTIYHWDFPKPRPPYAVSGYKSARDAYKELWVEINGRESLDANPWVWIIEFKRVEASS